MFAVYNSTGIQLPHSAEDQGMDARGTTVPLSLIHISEPTRPY